MESLAADCPRTNQNRNQNTVCSQCKQSVEQSPVRVAGQLNQLKVGAKKKQNQIGAARTSWWVVLAKNELVKWKNWQCSWRKAQKKMARRGMGGVEKVLKYI